MKGVGGQPGGDEAQIQNADHQPTKEGHHEADRFAKVILVDIQAHLFMDLYRVFFVCFVVFTDCIVLA